jgi:hypothetical protein
MSNRTLIILFCSFVSIFIFRNEVRMNNLEDRLDQIIDSKETIKYTKHDLDCLTKNIYRRPRWQVCCWTYYS